MNKSEQTAIPAQPEVYTRRKLNALYREIPLKDTTFRQLRKYLSAMAKLYGIIPLRKVYDIIAEQSASLVGEQDFAAFAEIARHECEDYRILGADELLGGTTASIFERELIDSALLADGGVRYAQMKQMQADKPYYIPNKTTLLCYQDENFYEPSEKVEALRDWMTTHFAIEEQHAHDVFARIAYEIRRETRTPLDIMELLTEAHCTFTTKQEVEEFMQIFAAYCNHAPMQVNRGYAPTTLSKLLGASKAPQGMYTSVTVRSAQKPTLSYSLMDVVHAHSYPNTARQSMKSDRTPAQTVRQDKVGRNQPCPCGSGKKYKKCHGR